MLNSTEIKGLDYAISAIAMTKTNKNAGGRKALANAAVRIGNYDAAGKRAWQEYLDAGCPAA